MRRSVTKRIVGDRPALLDRIFENCTRMGACLVWRGATNAAGYAVASVDGKMRGLARVVVEATDEETIAGGLEVDHLCLNRRCVERAHLEVVTRAENRRRALVRTAPPVPAALRQFDEELTARAQVAQDAGDARIVADIALLRRCLARILVDRSGCWLWCGPLRKHYPAAYSPRSGVPVSIRRLMVMATGGESSWKLTTSCGNRRCVNPSHFVRSERVTQTVESAIARLQSQLCAVAHQLKSVGIDPITLLEGSNAGAGHAGSQGESAAK